MEAHQNDSSGTIPHDEDRSIGDAGDTTVIADEVEETLDNGDSDEFNFASALALRKNLTKTFDKHANTEGKVAPCQKLGDVKSKIAHLEMKSNKEKENHGSRVQFKIAGVGKPALPKPPKIPVIGASNDGANRSGNSRLSVYLRIRPSVAGSNSNFDRTNTVEILDAEEQNGGLATTIRAYPPHDSNAAKVVRSQHHLHANSANTDLIFGNGAEEGRGVKEYEFSEVFKPDSSQSEVYNGVAAPLVEGLFPKSEGSDGGDSGGKLVGQSALLFAYGITNAGKTYTIMGDGESKKADWQESSHTDLHPNRGIMPRALHDMLRRINETENQEFHLNMSYFEIYNEQVYDLLVDAVPGHQATGQGGASHRRPSNHQAFGPVPLKLRESRDGKIFVRGLKKYRVTSVAYGLELATMAKKNRHTSSNNINSDSSRSHCICQLELVARPGSTEEAQCTEEMSGYNTDEEEAFVKKNEQRSVAMWIVDLAGSERSKRTGTLNKSARQKEAALINSSLMKLTRCIQTLRNNQLPKAAASASSMVPFRESKLTHLFMNHLTGASASRTSMIVNINPCAADYDETQHVLSYATVARSVVISESDYNRKRNAIAANCSQHTHGDDGRPLKSGRPKSPPRKIARLAAKLSPRSMLAKRREQQDAKAQKRKAEFQSMRGAAATSASALAGPNKKLKGSHSSGYLGKQFQGKITRHNSDEIQRLRSALTVTKEEVAKLQSEALELKAEAADRAAVEAEIRMEVSQEMEEQMQSMREQYNTIVNRLKMQIKSQPTPGKSARKVQLDKAEQYIDELMDKVDECEEEMVRMRDLHNEELTKLRKSHEEAIAAKSVEILSIKEMHDAEMTKLKSELEACQNENEELHALLRDECEDSGETSSDEEEGSTRSVDEGKSPTPRMRRLRRDRCSEVACSNVSPNKEDQASSKKKRGIRILRNKVASSEKKSKEQRLPLTTIPHSTADNVPRRSSTESNKGEIDRDQDAANHNIVEGEEETGLRRSRRLESL